MCVLLPKKFHTGWEQIFNGASVGRVVSDKLEPVSEWRKTRRSAGTKLPPLDQPSGSIFLEILFVIEIAFLF